ncbi:hypothetical protein [Polaromonas sp.]|uniref:hypothetical protein n=1 Tax=Polaromonas sp. TaxID=1869339 RepID=UPI0025FCDF59|nr:hypothetical protein [Polaromonas sp.]
MSKNMCLFVAVVLLHAPAWAINKCTEADGKVSFQDAPCLGKGEAISVRPASGQAPRQPVSPSGAKPLTEAQRIEGLVSQSQTERRTRDLQELWIPKAQADVLNNRQGCEQRTRKLDYEKNRSSQTLAGTVHRASVTSELAAHVSVCDTKDRELKEALDTLQTECKKLGCK